MIVTRLLVLMVTGMFTIVACGGGEQKTAEPTPPTTAATPPAAQVEDDEDIDPLLAWADSDVDEGSAPLTVHFIADVEGGKPPLVYKWTFGDGSPASSEANPVHVYEKPGSYTADLEVKDASGDEDSDYLEIDVE